MEVSNSLDLWHARMGHPSTKITKLISTVNCKPKDRLNDGCDVCHHAKQTRDKFNVSNNKASDLFELIHCDLWGPYRISTSCGASYFFFTVVDNYYQSIWIFLLIDKTEVTQFMKNFFVMVERQFNKQIKMVRTDNGTEFFGLKQFFSDNGVLFQTSPNKMDGLNESIDI